MQIKGKCGSSFPSRHAFSAFAIAVALLPEFMPLGIVLLAFGTALCAVRVLLGLHFVRDVVAGAVIGIVASVIGLLIF